MRAARGLSGSSPAVSYRGFPTHEAPRPHVLRCVPVRWSRPSPSERPPRCSVASGMVDRLTMVLNLLGPGESISLAILGVFCVDLSSRFLRRRRILLRRVAFVSCCAAPSPSPSSPLSSTSASLPSSSKVSGMRCGRVATGELAVEGNPASDGPAPGDLGPGVPPVAAKDFNLDMNRSLRERPYASVESPESCRTCPNSGGASSTWSSLANCTLRRPEAMPSGTDPSSCDCRFEVGWRFALRIPDGEAAVELLWGEGIS